MKNLRLACVMVLSSALLSLPAFAQDDEMPIKRTFHDAVVSTYVHEFEPVKIDHQTKVLIDRYHQTIYASPDEENGTLEMQRMLQADGFSLASSDQPYQDRLADFDLLIIHGLPNNKIELENGGVFWKSPLSDSEVEAIVKFVDNGGGLFLTLSHWPNGSGALPLLEALSVKFRDGYIWSKEAPSFTDPKNGICSHYFGLSEEDGTLKVDHPALKSGLDVKRVDYLCGAAIFREKEDAIIRFPPSSINYSPKGIAKETSDDYAGLIGFQFGKGKVVIAGDQGMFRNFIFTFKEGEKLVDLPITLTESNDNANLFIDMMRWISPKIP